MVLYMSQMSQYIRGTTGQMRVILTSANTKIFRSLFLPVAFSDDDNRFPGMHSQRGRAVWLAILRRPAGTCYNGGMCDTPGQITRRGHVVCRYGGGAVPATGSFYCTNQAGKHRLSTNYRPAQSCHWFNFDRCMASLAWRIDQPDQPFCRPGGCFVSLDGKYLHAELCT